MMSVKGKQKRSKKMMSVKGKQKRSKKMNDDLVSSRKKKRNVIYSKDDDSPRLLQEEEENQQQQSGRKQRTSWLSKCSTGLETKEGSKNMDISNKSNPLEEEEDGDEDEGTFYLSNTLRDYLVTYRPQQKRSKRSKRNEDWMLTRQKEVDDDLLLTRKKKMNNSIYYEYDDPRLFQEEREQRKKLREMYISNCTNTLEDEENSDWDDDRDFKDDNDPDYEAEPEPEPPCADYNGAELQIGDTLNLSDILFTKDRDYLVTFNDRDRPVKAKHLEGKVIVLHFVPLVCRYNTLKRSIFTLVDIYNALHPNAAFEVVFIGVKLARYASKPKKLVERFKKLFPFMPWPAIPFSHIKSPEYYANRLRFSFSGMSETMATSVVVDPTGVVLQTCADDIFFAFGAEAYPFSYQRIDFLESQDREALDHPSITTLLTSPQRDYLINNKNQVVPLHTLEDKVVALYFYQEGSSINTKNLERAYEQFAKAENFEIVFVYIPHTYESCQYASEDAFWRTFRSMPWLALPYKDSKWITLKRIFKLPWDDEDETGPDQRLVIVGPQGKFIEPYGADILSKFGISALPFTRQRVAQIDAKFIQKLKLKMFWDPNTCFRHFNGGQVKLSQLVGKRIIVVFESEYNPVECEFWNMLGARYLQMKDTDDEFFVICVCQKKWQTQWHSYSYGGNFKTLSWLRHPPIIEESNISNLLLGLFGLESGLVAFDHSGRVVRNTISPSIQRGNMVFPFHAAGLEEGALRRLVNRFEWDHFCLD